MQGLNFKDPNLLYFVGNSSLPINTAVGQVYKHIAMGLVVDIRTSQILDANVTLVSPLGKDFVAAQIVGCYLEKDLEQIIEGIEKYQGPAQKSLIVALRNAYDRYKNYMKDID